MIACLIFLQGHDCSVKMVVAIQIDLFVIKYYSETSKSNSCKGMNYGTGSLNTSAAFCSL
jgi:hypothetical protein